MHEQSSTGQFHPPNHFGSGMGDGTGKGALSFRPRLLPGRHSRQEGNFSMALFAPKCDRCGRRTRQTEDDKPICQTCSEEMALLLEAGNEIERPCPVDGTHMAKEIVHMLVVDRCPQCHGVWLDEGELERLKEGVQMEAVLATTRGLTSPLI